MRPTLRVLEVLSPPDGTTRFVDQVVSDLPDDVSVDWFSWRAALTGGYDVLHVHWPEWLVRARGGWVRTWATRAAFLALLLRLRLRRTAVVRTLHNPEPHEAGDRVEGLLLSTLDRATTLTIHPVPPAGGTGARDVVIPLGHYRARFASAPHSARVAGRLVYFGTIRDYKGVDLLLDAFAALEDPTLTLRVVGKPHTDAWRRRVLDAADADPRVSHRLEFVPDDELVAEVTSGELAVLPYRELHNSAVVLVALSLGTPVLVPSTPTTRALAEEVGPGWVSVFDGDLDTTDLRRAVDDLRANPPAEPPRLSGRDWELIGAAHGDAFRRAVALRHGAP